MKRILLLCLLLNKVALAQTSNNAPALIPQPVSMVMGKGSFQLSANTVIVSDGGNRGAAEFLQDYVKRLYGLSLTTRSNADKNVIRLTTRTFIQAPDNDNYNLSITLDGVTIEGDTYAATFYGVQTLLQLLPTTNHQPLTTNLSLPVLSVADYPRFAYRGMHLDVSRHFFGVDFIKKYIDYLALHKLNYFHWHLTDDQGWRIEIKKHPKLVSTGAYRNGTIVGRYPGVSNDNLPYGGYYTQEEVKEVVEYAAKRFITVVPEIEMPGHASAAIAAYPWLSCFPNEPTKIPTHPSERSKAQGGKLVQETWGVFPDVFCGGNDSTFTFLQQVLDEVLPLFPSQYIHVGGDECPKANWKRCPKCQSRIKALELKDEHGLQSYFITRMEKYLNAKGKTIIGWDEILEGGLAPNAVVMSWRGEKGGIEAARQKHKVIMTPEKPMYFDHSQTRNEDSIIIGGYNPIEAVYAYNPVPKELSPEEGEYILGAQANVWAEYSKNPSRIEYNIFPRMAALSEVMWSPKEKRDWKDFERRLPAQFKRYELWKASYSKAYFSFQTAINPTADYDGVEWVLSNRFKYPITSIAEKLQLDKPDTIAVYDVNDMTRILRYDMTYIRYQNFIVQRPGDTTRVSINRSGLFRARRYELTQHPSTPDFIKSSANPLIEIEQYFAFNKATGKKVTITTQPQPKYPGQGGAFSLVNGIYSNKGLSYPDWLGWIGDDLEATIDLSKTETVDSVRLHTLASGGSWVYKPQYVEVFTSTNGKDFVSEGRSSTIVSDTLTTGWITVRIKKASALYIKVIAKNYGLIPDGQSGAGNKAWLFADEIQVY